MTLSDYQDSVIDNLINNLKENKNNHQHLNDSFDFVLKKDNNIDHINDNKQVDKHFNKIELNNGNEFIIKI